MSGKSSKAPIAVPVKVQLRRLRLRTLPVIVWFLAVVASAVLMNRAMSGSSELQAIAYARDYAVAPLRDSIVNSLGVQLYDTVKAGDVVAELFADEVEAELRVLAAKSRELSAEVEAERARLSYEITSDANDGRRFYADAEQARADLLSARVQLEADLVELQRLKVERDREARLSEIDSTSATSADLARYAHEQMLAKIREEESLIAELERNRNDAEARLEVYKAQDAPNRTNLIEQVLRPLEMARETNNAQLEEIQARRKTLTLRAPIDGVVSSITVAAGQAVRAGTPVLVVTPQAPEYVVAYAPEDRMRNVRPGDRAMIVLPTGAAASPTGARVVATGPKVELYSAYGAVAANSAELPSRPTQLGSPILPGRPLLLIADSPLPVLPGERLGVILDPNL